MCQLSTSHSGASTSGSRLPRVGLLPCPVGAARVHRVGGADQRVPLHQRMRPTTGHLSDLRPRDQRSGLILDGVADARVGRVATWHGLRHRADSTAQPRGNPPRLGEIAGCLAAHPVVAVVSVIVGAALLLRSLRQVRATLSSRHARHR